MSRRNHPTTPRSPSEQERAACIDQHPSARVIRPLGRSREEPAACTASLLGHDPADAITRRSQDHRERGLRHPRPLLEPVPASADDELRENTARSSDDCATRRSALSAVYQLSSRFPLSSCPSPFHSEPPPSVAPLARTLSAAVERGHRLGLSNPLHRGADRASSR